MRVAEDTTKKQSEKSKKCRKHEGDDKNASAHEDDTTRCAAPFVHLKQRSCNLTIMSGMPAINECAWEPVFYFLLLPLPFAFFSSPFCFAKVWALRKEAGEKEQIRRKEKYWIYSLFVALTRFTKKKYKPLSCCRLLFGLCCWCGDFWYACCFCCCLRALWLLLFCRLWLLFLLMLLLLLFRFRWHFQWFLPQLIFWLLSQHH